MLVLLALLAGCTGAADNTDDKDTSPVDPGDTDVVTADCNTENESCAPRTCSGEGSRMLPGSDCVSCHSRGSGDDEAPAWSIAGTAFVDRDGSAPLEDAIIRVTGADGAVVTLTTNAVGNFFSDERVEMPYTAEIEVGGETRSMGTAPEYGGCNSCHSCEGTAAGKLRGP
ncbi:MAG: hypothetical protein Q8P18_06835 [Pseudomonadota bacterium]|nr:hypothetical protein [Pseudomonadota bacterium]